MPISCCNFVADGAVHPGGIAPPIPSSSSESVISGTGSCYQRSMSTSSWSNSFPQVDYRNNIFVDVVDRTSLQVAEHFRSAQRVNEHQRNHRFPSSDGQPSIEQVKDRESPTSTATTLSQVGHSAMNSCPSSSTSNNAVCGRPLVCVTPRKFNVFNFCLAANMLDMFSALPLL